MTSRHKIRPLVAKQFKANQRRRVMDKIKRTTMELTPELASQFLCNIYEEQRKIDTGHMKQLSRDIRDGRWSNDVRQFDPIMFSPDGKLLNGQHRCKAVVDAGKSIVVDVLTDVPEDLFRYLDGGKSRTLQQFVKVKNSHTVAALSKFANAIESGVPLTSAISGRVETANHCNVRASRTELLDYIEKNIELLGKCAYEASRIYESFGKAGSKAMFADALWTISYISDHSNWDEIMAFVDEVISDSPSHPALASGKSLAVKKLVEQLRNANRIKLEFWLYWLLAMYKALGTKKKTLTMGDVNGAAPYFDKILKIM